MKYKFKDTDGDFRFKALDWSGPTEYNIIFPKNDHNSKIAASILKNYYKINYNIEIKILSDNTKCFDKEILIGKTNRQESNIDIKESDLEVSFKNNKLVFDGGHYVTLRSAVEKFLSLKPDVNKIYTFKLSTDFKSKVLDGYEYVWGDEFDGTEIDMTKWDFEDRMKGTAKIKISWDKDVIDVGNGKLKLHAVNYRDHECESIRYKVPYSVVTKYKMNFTYGYAEIRARVPFYKGSWPSFWALSANAEGCPFYNLDLELKRLYESEIDIFEVFGHESQIIPNIHKWYKTDRIDYGKICGQEGKYHTMISLEDKSIWDWAKKDIDLKNLSNEYHIYGFEWTDKVMNFFVDGQKYYTLNIVNSYDLVDDMREFHSPIFLMFNNHVFADDLSWYSSLVEDNSLLPFCYYIDYLRIYQKPGVGEIFIDDKPKYYEGR